MGKNLIKYKYKEQEIIGIDTFSTSTQEGQPIATISSIDFESGETRVSQKILDKLATIINTYCIEKEIEDVFVLSSSYLGTFNCFKNIENISQFDLDKLPNLFRPHVLKNKKFLVLVDLTIEENTSLGYSRINKLSELIGDHGMVVISTSLNGFELIDYPLIEILEQNSLNIFGQFHLFSGNSKDYLSESFSNFCSANLYPEIDDFENNINFIFTTKEKINNKFVFEGPPDKLDETVISRFFNNSKDLEIENGKSIQSNNYIGPKSWQIKKENLKINKIFKTWKKYNFKEIFKLTKIIHISQKSENPSLIHFAAIKDKALEKNLISISNHTNYFHFKFQNEYFEFEINEELICSEFLSCFMNTQYGRLLLKLKSSKGVYTLEDFYELHFFFPEKIKQQEIALSIKNRSNIVKKFKDLKDELLINPSSFNYTKEKIEGILNVYNEIDEYTRVTSIISNGESDNLEFKQTFTLDTKDHNGGKNEKIELSALKTLAAFLNTRGGKLLIGIHDKGEILGVDKEIKLFGNDVDKYKLFIKDKIKNRLGAQVADYIQWDVRLIGDVKIVEFTCAQSIEPVWIDKKDFYIRMSPATELLEGQAIYQYTNSHFSKKSGNQ